MAKDPLKKLARRYVVSHGGKFSLDDVDPSDTMGLDLRERARDLLTDGVERLATLQERLYAQDRWSLLLIFQAMDAAGKDGTIKHVMSGINPQGCQVSSFKQPSPEELDHDFLWRAVRHLPERGRIGIFNRSYYEEVLVVRVHANLLDRQRLPQELVDKHIWRDRFRHIRHFEEYLADQGTVIRKFFLHVSKDEQRRRFLDRLSDPDKNWKFAASDVEERAYFEQYMRAYEDAIRHTATNAAPWIVVPADHKWFTRLVVAAVIADALEQISPSYPTLDREQRKQLDFARQILEEESGSDAPDGDA